MSGDKDQNAAIDEIAGARSAVELYNDGRAHELSPLIVWAYLEAMVKLYDERAAAVRAEPGEQLRAENAEMRKQLLRLQRFECCQEATNLRLENEQLSAVAAAVRVEALTEAADAIDEFPHNPPTTQYREGLVDGYSRAARLVRGLAAKEPKP